MSGILFFSNYHTFSLPYPSLYSWLFRWTMSSLIYLLPLSTLLGVIYSISIIVLPRVSTRMTSFFSQVNSPELQMCSKMCVRDIETYTKIVHFFLLLEHIYLHKKINISIKHYYALSLNKFPNDYDLKTTMSSHMYGKES